MVKNIAEFNFVDLYAIFNDDELINIPNDINTKSVCVDSRDCVANSIFIALTGENTDGHNFIDAAVGNGAAVLAISKEWYSQNKDKVEGKSLIVADIGLLVLQQLALHHRMRFETPIIAVAGSNGKTSTKEMIADVLSVKFNVLRSFANFNNQLGVPLMLLSLTEEYDCAVLELGTNYPGEISIITEFMQPTHGVITNIGKEHLELLVDLDGVEAEETSLFGALHNRGIAFVNTDDERLAKYSKILPNNLAYGTTDEAQVKGIIIENDELTPELTIKFNDREINAKLQTFGYFSAYNALVASAVAIAFKMSDEDIKKGLENCKPFKGQSYARMLLEDVNGIKVINDCYNANPSSAVASLENLKHFKQSGKKIAVLGDMLELGCASLIEHEAILELAIDIADEVYLFGLEYEEAFSNIDDNIAAHYKEKTELIEDLIRNAEQGDIILVKGSRGMKMEEIIESMKKS